MAKKKDMIDNMRKGKSISVINERLSKGNIDNKHENCEGLDEAIRREDSSRNENKDADNLFGVP